MYIGYMNKLHKISPSYFYKIVTYLFYTFDTEYTRLNLISVKDPNIDKNSEKIIILKDTAKAFFVGSENTRMKQREEYMR